MRMQWGKLQGPIIEPLEAIAKRDGLRSPLVIIMARGTTRNINEHWRRAGHHVNAIQYKGEINIFPFMWREMLETEGVEAVTRDIARVIAHEIRHQIDLESSPAWWPALRDCPHRLSHKLFCYYVTHPGLKVGRKIAAALYFFFYKRSYYERRANRYAAERTEEYYQAINPFMRSYIQAYRNWSRGGE